MSQSLNINFSSDLFKLQEKISEIEWKAVSGLKFLAINKNVANTNKLYNNLSVVNNYLTTKKIIFYDFSKLNFVNYSILEYE